MQLTKFWMFFLFFNTGILNIILDFSDYVNPQISFNLSTTKFKIVRFDSNSKDKINLIILHASQFAVMLSFWLIIFFKDIVSSFRTFGVIIF